jgi:alkyl hydroperoxide reductase subunit AhpC
MRAFEEAMPRFARLNTQVLGISVDSVPTKEAWAKSLGIKSFPLMSDFWPHGEIARRYGVFDEEKGFAKRVVFVVDKEGLIRFSKVYAMREVPDVGNILEVVRRLEAK